MSYLKNIVRLFQIYSFKIIFVLVLGILKQSWDLLKAAYSCSEQGSQGEMLKVLFGSVNVGPSQKGHFIIHGHLCYGVFLITKYFH